MFTLIFALLAALLVFPRHVYGHISIWHPSMWGFNVTQQTYSYDNRPVAPLTNMPFNQWWFHGHLDHPPNQGDFFDLPAGGTATTELGCNKGATSFFASSEGGDIRNGNDPCPGSPMSEWHTNGIQDLFGCSLAIAYKSDVTQVQPEDFTVFSVNQTCVWTRFTDFQVPQKMPACPEGGCICAWFWIHSPDSGGEQNYMNGFRCNITGPSSTVALATPQVPRRCGADPVNGKMQDAPGNCTYGAKQPFYWFQQERNNMFEGTYSPPRYLDMYNFKDGAQNDIFSDSYPSGIPPPSPNSTVVPTPFLGISNSAQTTFSASSTAASTSSASLSSSSVTSSSVSASSPSSASSGTLSTAISSLGSASPPPSPSVSVSVSTATVISTAVVTVTQLSPSSTPSATSTATVVNTVFLTVTAPAVPSSSAAAEPSTSTAFVFVTAPSPVASNAAFAQLDRVEDDAIDGSSDSSAEPSSPPAESSASQMCKRGAPPISNPLRRRASSIFSVPGVGRHRKMQRRSDIWNLVF